MIPSNIRSRKAQLRECGDALESRHLSGALVCHASTCPHHHIIASDLTDCSKVDVGVFVYGFSDPELQLSAHRGEDADLDNNEKASVATITRRTTEWAPHGPCGIVLRVSNQVLLTQPNPRTNLQTPQISRLTPNYLRYSNKASGAPVPLTRSCKKSC
ncbi:hypothetical protein EDB84DRAFT_1472832 [Lactarius hengduanensis]|nr:hypothetical protein EDB84DRAFT_1472832 [Lactarius hengduanensis]